MVKNNEQLSQCSLYILTKLPVICQQDSKIMNDIKVWAGYFIYFAM